MEDYNLLIAGGNDFKSYKLLKTKVDALLAEKLDFFDIIIVSGVTKGAGMLAEKYAAEKGYEVAEFHAAKVESIRDHLHRQQDMAGFADSCVCFWDGRSACTGQLIALVTETGKKLSIITY